MRKLAFTILIVLALAIVAYSAYKNIEYYDEDVNLGWSQKARVQPFLAASLLLQKQDIKVDQTLRFDSTIDMDEVDTIILPNPSYAPRESQQRRLLEWVKAGGHLLIGSEAIKEDSFLFDLGFTSEYLDTDDDDNEEVEEELSLADSLRKQNEELLNQQQEEKSKEETNTGRICIAPSEIECHPMKEDDIDIDQMSAIYFEDNEQSRYYDYYSSLSIYHEAMDEDDYYWTGNENRTTFIQAPYGEGYFSVLTSLEAFTNDRLGQLEHAYILSRLVRGDDKVLIVYGRDAVSLLDLIKHHYAYTLFALTLFLFATVIFYGRRFGTTHTFKEQTQRKLSERLKAAGLFSWRIRDEQSLLEELRQDIGNKAQRHAHNFRDLSQTDQISLLAELSGLSEESIELSLYTELSFQEQQYFTIVNTLQKLRNTL